MKNLKQFILEGKKHVDPASIGDFAKWYCLGEMPDGKEGKVDPEDCVGLIDNGWFEVFPDEDPKKVAEFINKNWDEIVRVTSIDLKNTWEISFEFNGTRYSVDAVSYFGDDIDY